MFKTLSIIMTMALTIVTSLNQITIVNYHRQTASDDSTILQEQSLTLAFQGGDFYPWNENNDTTSIDNIGIITNNEGQSYLLHKDGTYDNLDLQISNFIRFNDNSGIATLSNYHQSTNNNLINNSFLMDKNGINGNAIATVNHTFVNFGTNIVSTDIGADLISPNGKVTNLVAPYTYGKGKTSFTAINDTFGIFVGGNQHYYLLKNDGTITAITINNKPFIAPNPILLSYFVPISNNSGIIRNINGQLFYLIIDNNGNTTIVKLTIDKTTPLFSTTINFFSKTNNNQGILNVNIENSSKLFGQPYYLDVTTSNDIKFTKINEHYLNNFILLHHGLGIFIDEQQLAYFVDDAFTFTKIGSAINFQKINDNLGIIDNNLGKLLLSDSKNNDWKRINSINFTKTKVNQLANFINAHIDKGKTTTAVERTNSWISNDNLILNVTNNELVSITINNNPPLLPKINNDITTLINSNAKIAINFQGGQTINYSVIIYANDVLPTLDNDTNTNNKYVGVVNNNLYDINSTNSNDGFTINFDYQTTIQFVNIITIDSSNMNKVNLWTLKPNTTFKLNSGENSKVYLLQTVNWNNISNWQYFTIYRNDSLPIINFWTTTAGIKLWNTALKLNYTTNQLTNMNASQINNLKTIINWKIPKTNSSKIIGYVIVSFLSTSFILAIAAIIYDWYLKQQLKNKR